MIQLNFPNLIKSLILLSKLNIQIYLNFLILLIQLSILIIKPSNIPKHSNSLKPCNPSLLSDPTEPPKAN